MKHHFFLFTLLFIIGLSSCDNSTIGSIIQPEDDKMKVRNDSFIVKAENVLLKERYSESEQMELGHINDPIFGSFRLDQVMSFRYNPIRLRENAVGDSLYIMMYYSRFTGDSLAVLEASAYALNQPLKFETAYTADFNVADICDKSQLLGRQAYTAYDITIPDSVRVKEGFRNRLKISLPTSYVEKLVNNPTYFDSQELFDQFLKGVYVTNSYGEDVVLDIDSANLVLRYHYSPKAKPDTTIYAKRIFPANREVTEFISVTGIKEPAVQNDSLLYLVSSSGYVIHLEFPLERIKERLTRLNPDLNELNVNFASIILQEALLEKKESFMMPPPFVILIREDDVKGFFSQSLYPDQDRPTVLGKFNPKTGSYQFTNTSWMVEDILKGKLDPSKKNNSFYIIPVSGTTNIQGTDAVIRHEYKPYGVRLRSSKNQKSPIRLALTYSVL